DETGSPYFPSGLRMGTPAVTTRGMKETEMKMIANWIDHVVIYLKKQNLRFPNQESRKKFKQDLKDDSFLTKIKTEVKSLCSRFPTPS
ncbi:MAG: serine hydroxymethyltransferase, partial [Microgenomates group bacterium Gr01-1014_16]